MFHVAVPKGRTGLAPGAAWLKKVPYGKPPKRSEIKERGLPHATPRKFYAIIKRKQWKN